MYRLRMPLFLLIGLVLASGCGGRVTVSGKVLEKGKPIPGAELRWASQSDTNLFISGASTADGSYVLDSGGKKGIPPGRYQVTVNWYRMRDGKPLPEGEAGSALKGTGKTRQYTATLDVEVSGSTTSLDLDVSGKATLVPEE